MFFYEAVAFVHFLVMSMPAPRYCLFYVYKEATISLPAIFQENKSQENGTAHEDISEDMFVSNNDLLMGPKIGHPTRSSSAKSSPGS